MKVIEWPDIRCTARIEIDNNSLKFEVFEITGNLPDKNGDYTINLYQRKGARLSDDAEELDEAQPLFRGFVKWDACSDVYFGDEGGYIHLCGGESWFAFMKAVERIWDIAMKELPQDHSADMFDLELFIPHK